jgi:hypothetical protein
MNNSRSYVWKISYIPLVTASYISRGNTIRDVVQPYGGQLSQGFSKRHAVDITNAARPLPNTFAQGKQLGFSFCPRSSLPTTMMNMPYKQHWTSLHWAVKLKVPWMLAGPITCSAGMFRQRQILRFAYWLAQSLGSFAAQPLDVQRSGSS